MMREHPDLVALLAGNDSMALGAVAAVKAAVKAAGKTGKVQVVGYDNIGAIKPMLADGRVLATADQYAAKQAVFGIELAQKALAAKTPQDQLPATVKTDVVLVLKDSKSAPLHAAARAQLAKIGLDSIDPATPVSQLGIGQQQMMEIARNLQDDTRILVLDEPTAMLTPRETTYLFEQIARLSSRGVAIVYVSHRLEELRRIATQVAVLRDGRLVDVCAMAGLSEDDLVRRMVGRSVNDLESRARRVAGPVVMQVDGIGRGTAVQDVSLALHAGEVFGIAGPIE